MRGIYWFTQAEEEYLERMKEESKGVPRLRLDMLRQLKSALAEGFSKNDKTGNRYKPYLAIDHMIMISWFYLNRSKDRQLLRTVCEEEVVCESVFGLMDLNGDGQLDADQLRGAISEKRFESGAKTAFVARHCYVSASPLK